MLSRAVLSAGALRPILTSQLNNRLALVCVSRCNTTLTQHIQNWENANKVYYGPERDTKNFPIKSQPEFSPPTRHGFVPLTLLQQFYSKTGVTGPYMFVLTLSTYLVSKELWVVEHGFVEMFSFWTAFYVAQKKIGPMMTSYLDEQSDAYRKSRWDEPLAESKAIAEVTIDEAQQLVQNEEGQKYLFESKRENVDLQLESHYRQRMDDIHNAVKKRLDYQVDLGLAKRQFQQQHMVNWIVRGVQSKITPQQEKDSIKQCITDLKSMSTHAAAV